MDATQLELIRTGQGFFAALDQSGGSTPKALAEYGIAADRYAGEAEMFDLVHAMRTRVMTSPAFDGSRILAAILFEQTMQRSVQGRPTAAYLWEEKRVVPFLKVDEGLADAEHDVQLMKPIAGLNDRLAESVDQRIFGTKMRSVIKDANEQGIADVVDQQFGYAATIADAGLVPILEPEVSIDSPHKAEAETLLLTALQSGLTDWPTGVPLLLKLTIPTTPGLYAPLAADPRVLRLLALSGGYSRDQACTLLAHDSVMIASFSRALLEGLLDSQTDNQFNGMLDASVAQIFAASTHKQV